VLLWLPGVMSKWMFLPLRHPFPHISAGTIRVLAVCFDKRDALLPKFQRRPNWVSHLIYLPFWHGISGPPKMPAYIVDVWTRTLQEMMKDKEYLEQIDKLDSGRFTIVSSGNRVFMKEREVQRMSMV